MIWVVLGAVGLVVLVVGSVVAGCVELVCAPQREALSQRQFWFLAALGGVAFMAMLTLVATPGGGWFVVPIVMWVAALAIARNSAPMRETKQQRVAREDSEKRRAAARDAVRERKHADAFGKDGLGLMNRAKMAVDNVIATEAAREGWLGDLDFSADLATISESLLQLVASKKLRPSQTPSLNRPMMTLRCCATPSGR